MNINNGKTGIIDIPGALHSTGGDGDNQVGGVVAYTGDIYDTNLNRNQADINENMLVLDEHYNLLINKDYINVEGYDNLLRGGAILGYALSGSNSQYELVLYDDNWYQNNLHYQFVKFLQDSKILDNELTPIATITNATYNSSNKKITITTDTDLGELDGEYFNMYNQNIASNSFCSGMFLNKGGYSTLIGNDNYNTGYGNILLGDNNTNNGEQTVLIGSANAIKSDTDNCYILGDYNKVNGESNLYTVGGYNTSTGDDLYSFALGGDINFTKGSTTGNDWITQVGIGEYLNISQNEFVLGQYNKDYDIADSSKRNFFVIGNGTESTRSNSLEQKANGDLYIKGIGNFDGTNSNENTTKSLQEILNEKADSATVSTALNDLSDRIDNAGGVTSYNDLTDKPTILDSYDVTQIVLKKSAMHYDNNSNFVTYDPNGTNDTSYTPNSITNTSNTVLVGKFNTLSNSNDSVVIGKSNTNSDEESVVIGVSNTNDKENSTVVGSYNINHSEKGVSIGYYNQNLSTTEHNISIGHDNNIFHNMNGIVIGDYNLIAQNVVGQDALKIIAIGKNLSASNDSITLGFYNANYNGGTLMPKFAVGNGTSNSSRSNILEQFDNGDLYIKGLGGFTGNNSQYNKNTPYECKTLQTIITDLQTKSTNNDTIINEHFTDNNSIKVGTAINVSGTDSIAGGAGVSLTGNRAFGYGTSMGAIYLTGDEGTYSARLYSTSNYTNQNNIADAFATTHLNSYLLKTSDFSRVAQITAITYNGADQPLTITLDTDLGNLSNAVYAIENVAGTKSFNGGSFGNTGQNSSVIGYNNYNKGNYSSILGSINNNNGTYSTVLGYLDKNTGNYSSVIGSMNNNAAIYSNVIGLMNTNDSTATYSNIIGRNNTNKCSSTSIVGIGNTVNETTYPSVITGYENIADVATQQFTLGYGNHGTRGQYAEGNASASWMIGHHLTTSSGCWALGKYNKDYDVQDTTKQNFFVIGQGDTNAPLNSVELKRNGNLYIYNVGGFNGTNSDNANIKTLQTVINELQNTVTSLQSRITALENQLNGTNA